MIKDFLDTFEYVEHLLKNHKKIRAEIEMTKLELTTLEDTDAEAIEGIVFKGKDLGAPSSNSKGRHGDSTSAAAVKYGKEKENTHKDLKSLQKLIAKNEVEIQKLDLAVDCLKNMQKKIIKALYYDCLKWKQVRRKYGIGDETININRVKGIEEISNMFKKKNLIEEEAP